MKHPTWPSLVLELLSAKDDLMSEVQIITELGGQLTSRNRARVRGALLHLRNHRAVDCIIEGTGVSWWFATPDLDTRVRKILQREEELKPRNCKKRRKKKCLFQNSQSDTRLKDGPP